MKVLVIYDSLFGNTEKIAHAIGKGFGAVNKVEVLAVEQVTQSDVAGVDLLVVGSPTQGGQPTVKLRDFLQSFPRNSLRGVNVAAFDTSFDENSQNLALRLLMKTIGYAAPKLAATLKGLGGQLVAQPAIFIVNDKEGPLKAGELERSKKWAASLQI